MLLPLDEDITRFPPGQIWEDAPVRVRRRGHQPEGIGNEEITFNNEGEADTINVSMETDPWVEV